MNWVDSAVLGVAAISAILGFARGFIREVFGLGAWVGAIYVAIYYVDLVRGRIGDWVSDPAIAGPLAYAAVFLPSLIVLSLVTHMLGNAARRSMLGSLDRTLGVAFGVARAALLVAAAYVALGWLEPNANWPEPVREARSMPYAYALTVWLARYLPDQYRPLVAPPPPRRETSSADLLQLSPRGPATGHP